MMRRRDFLVRGRQTALGLSLLSLAGCLARKHHSTGSTSPRLEALLAELERQIPQWMNATNVPGLSLVIIEEARVAAWRGFGVKDAESKVPVDQETMFEAASMSKPVFAYLVMKLCERGVLGLDTPLTRYTSERFVQDDPRLDLITARHILSHTSGLPNWRSNKEPIQILFTPGQKWLYSGEGYYYLQSVVTHLTGQVNAQDCARFEGGFEVCATDIEAYIKANLLEPLGLVSSSYSWNDRVARKMARPHDSSGRPKNNRKSTPPSVARYASSGALLITPTDYAKFLIEVMAPGPGDAFRLKRKSVQEMLRPQVKLEGEFPRSWALGWEIFHQPDFIYHGGDNDGFHCGALASVKGGRGYVVMTNGDKGYEVLEKLVTHEKVQQFLRS